MRIPKERDIASLISDACEAEEIISYEELEEFAKEWRTACEERRRDAQAHRHG